MAETNLKGKSMNLGEHSSPRKKIRKKSDLANDTKLKQEGNSPVRRKINREEYWKIPPPPNTDDTDQCSSLYAELNSLREFHSLIDMPPVVKRFYRKMFVYTNFMKGANKVLDDNSSASVGIVNKISLCLINCSYTNRVLKPFIFQDFEVIPPWLKMQHELREGLLERFPGRKIKKNKKHPINYMYITADHIPAINSLAETYFWPGIDVSIALSYPEFSCVALYKKIIVGFGMMAPGTHLNEAYISFFLVRPHWRKSGIGTFILYHLINTAISWDITLHAALSNDAILLYNKFTFKVHKMVRNFYDERLPINTSQLGHAFFMQLEKSVIT